MTNHPLGDEIYIAYAAGALSAPMRLLVETQAAVRNEVREECELAEAAAGALLEQIPPAGLKPGALDQVFAAIDAERASLGEAGAMRAVGSSDERRDVSAASAAGRAIEELLSLPGSVRDHALEVGQWNFAGPGVRRMELMRDGSAKAELIRLEPGRGVPRHGHDCREFTLVLTGAFHDGLNRYGAGELCTADPSLEHKPVAEEGEVCIALAVTDGPLAFTGPLGWVQRAIGALS
ncbi:ChrR family anti-sigma-E factor [Marinicauda sp. Alg238-R41]|uniref:ChrR family anti-sigma-E factor n=1 Tax=Marinicauda sp. Alg238-R41 TaxID=2993447 RepID=UPI0022E83B8A|nr:ChrR family anti-sigma-E factor [Marinicauda sp. Alg238-R41]